MLLKAVSALALGVAAIAGKTPPVAKNPKVPPVVTLTARDYAFDSIPDIPAGVVDLRLHNLGPDFHHAAIFKLFGGHTAAEFVAASKNPGPPPKWAMPVPGPNAPPVGGTSNVIAEYTPGSYVVLCFVDTNGGVPHFMKGMSRAFRVVPSANKAKGPKADIAATVVDYAFKFTPALTAGEHTVRITNGAKQLHEIEIFRLDDGKNAKELHDWLIGPMKSKPPADAVGGVVGVLPGSHPEFRVTLTAGHYVAICFVPDAKDGKPHFLHGMEYAFEVK